MKKEDIAIKLVNLSNFEEIVRENLGKDIIKIGEEYILIKKDSTSHLFWDCACDEKYTHYYIENECPVCMAKRSSQPDSYIRDLVKNGIIDIN